MNATKKPYEGGIQHWRSDWTAQCDAKCRKTGERCPHTCNSMIPSLLATGSPQADANWYAVQGKPANLCQGHWRSWHVRSKRLLTLPLIHGGHISPMNRYGYGSIIIKADRIDFERPKVKIPPAWGWIGWRGNVPEGLLERLPKLESYKEENTELCREAPRVGQQ